MVQTLTQLPFAESADTAARLLVAIKRPGVGRTAAALPSESSLGRSNT